MGYCRSGGKPSRESRAREFRLVDQPKLAYATRRCEDIENAETILLRARELYHDNAVIEFKLAYYASVAGRMEDAKERIRKAIELDKDIR
jgi:Flp pilus assembly protein TadD